MNKLAILLVLVVCVNGYGVFGSRLNGGGGADGRTSSITVAASDSTDILKRSADFVADGVDDSKTILSALDSLYGLSSPFVVENSGNAVMTFGQFATVWKDGATYYSYYAYDSYTKIGVATSSDGITWTADTANNPVLAVTGAGHENAALAVANVWKEGATWHVLYRGNGQYIYHTTGSDYHTFTRPGTEIVVKDVQGTTLIGSNYYVYDSAGIMKVGSTYYLYSNSTGGDRGVSVLTSTDLATWTLRSPNPTFTGSRYCSCPFKYDGNYYLIVSRYYHRSEGGTLELWKCPNAYFDDGNRTFVGIIAFNADHELDVPTLETADITRELQVGDDFNLWYSRGTAQYLYYIAEPDVATILAGAIVPGTGTISLLQGTYYLDITSAKGGVDVAYGAILEGNGSILKVQAGQAALSYNGVLALKDTSIARNLTIDGKNSSYANTGILITDRAVGENITIQNFNSYAAEIYSVLRNSTILNTTSTAGAAYVKRNGEISGCSVSGTVGTGIYLYGENAKATRCNVFLNGTAGQAHYGIRCYGNDSIVEDCKVYSNNVHGISMRTNTIARRCSVFENTGIGIVTEASTVNQLIEECSTFKNSSYGISIASSSDGVVVRNSRIYQNSEHGIFLACTGSCLFQNCVVWGGTNPVANKYGLSVSAGTHTFDGCYFYGWSSSSGNGEVAVTGGTNTFRNCKFAEGGVNQSYCLYDQGTGTQFFGCDFGTGWSVGYFAGTDATRKVQFSVGGYIVETWGNSTGTASEQTIAHGLSAIPTIVRISGDATNVNAYQSTAADATNIYITADTGETYHWEAFVR